MPRVHYSPVVSYSTDINMKRNSERGAKANHPTKKTVSNRCPPDCYIRRLTCPSRQKFYKQLKEQLTEILPRKASNAFKNHPVKQTSEVRCCSQNVRMRRERPLDRSRCDDEDKHKHKKHSRTATAASHHSCPTKRSQSRGWQAPSRKEPEQQIWVDTVDEGCQAYSREPRKTSMFRMTDGLSDHLKYGVFGTIRPSRRLSELSTGRLSTTRHISNQPPRKDSEIKCNRFSGGERGYASQLPKFIVRSISKRQIRKLSSTQVMHVDIQPRPRPRTVCQNRKSLPFTKTAQQFKPVEKIVSSSLDPKFLSSSMLGNRYVLHRSNLSPTHFSMEPRVFSSLNQYYARHPRKSSAFSNECHSYCPMSINRRVPRSGSVRRKNRKPIRTRSPIHANRNVCNMKKRQSMFSSFKRTRSSQSSPVSECPKHARVPMVRSTIEHPRTSGRLSKQNVACVRTVHVPQQVVKESSANHNMATSTRLTKPRSLRNLQMLPKRKLDENRERPPPRRLTSSFRGMYNGMQQEPSELNRKSSNRISKLQRRPLKQLASPKRKMVPSDSLRSDLKNGRFTSKCSVVQSEESPCACDESACDPDRSSISSYRSLSTDRGAVSKNIVTKAK